MMNLRLPALLLLLAVCLSAEPAFADSSRRRRVDKPPRDNSSDTDTASDNDPFDEDEDEDDDPLASCIGGCVGGFVEGMISGCIAGIFGGEVDDEGTVHFQETDRPGTDDNSTVTPLAHQFGIKVPLTVPEGEQTAPQPTTYPSATSSASGGLTREQLLERFERDYYNRSTRGGEGEKAGGSVRPGGRIFSERKVGRTTFGLNFGGGGFFAGDLRADYNDKYALQTFGFGAYAEIVPLRELVTGLSLYWEKNAWSEPQYNYEYDRYYTDSLGATRLQVVSEQPMRLSYYSTALTYDIGVLVEDVVYLGGSAGLALVEEKGEIREQVIDNGTVVADRDKTVSMTEERFVWGITGGLKQLPLNRHVSLELLFKARFVEGLPQQRKHPLSLDYINRLAGYTFLLGVGYTP